MSSRVLEKASVVLVLPHDFEIRGQRRHNQQIRSTPELLPRDAHTIRVNETNVWHLHRRSLPALPADHRRGGWYRPPRFALVALQVAGVQPPQSTGTRLRIVGMGRWRHRSGVVAGWRSARDGVDCRHVGAIWLRYVSGLRRSWRSWLVLALVCGVALSLPLAAAADAADVERAGTSPARIPCTRRRGRHRPVAYPPELVSTLLGRVDQLPQVSATARVQGVLLEVIGADGRFVPASISGLRSASSSTSGRSTTSAPSI